MNESVLTSGSGSAPKMKRKNTKSDLSFRSASFVAITPTQDDFTIGQTNEEASETVRIKRKSHKGPSNRVISAVMLWVKNINKMRTIQMTKAFYHWKYFRPATSTEAPSITHTSDSFNEQKSSYLQLFAENERLREQAVEIKRHSAAYEKQLRVSAMRTVLTSVIRKKIMMRIRYYFDLWTNNSRMEKMVIDSSFKALELEVGLQQVESERDYVRKTQVENTKLRMILSLTMYFFKWKSKVAMGILRDERTKYELQRQFLFTELRRMRLSISEANAAEQGVLHEAKERGNEAMEQILALREKLQQICMNSSGTAKSRSRANSGENDSSTGRKSVSVGGGSWSRRSSSRK
jgi:hypothetical protein